jgi:transcriptional antiterminator NusG
MKKTEVAASSPADEAENAIKQIEPGSAGGTTAALESSTKAAETAAVEAEAAPEKAPHAEEEVPAEEPAVEEETPAEEPAVEEEAPAEEPAAEEEAPAEEPAVEEEAPAEEPAAEEEAPAEEPAVEEEAPAEEPAAEEEAPAEEPAVEEEAPAEEPAAEEEAPAEEPATEEKAPAEEPAAEEEAPAEEPAAEEEAPAEEPAAEEEEEIDDGRSWYVVHSYSGAENKVKTNLEQRIESMNMQDKIFQVVVPTEEEIEIREGSRRKTKKRVFPGYILVQMILDEQSWYAVRNTPGVTGFVGSGTKPVPLRPQEADKIFKRMEAEAPKIKVSFRVGQTVRVVGGPFADFVGTVEELNLDKGRVRVMVSFFGRETPVELDFLQVQKQ